MLLNHNKTNELRFIIVLFLLLLIFGKKRGNWEIWKVIGVHDPPSYV